MNAQRRVVAVVSVPPRNRSLTTWIRFSSLNVETGSSVALLLVEGLSQLCCLFLQLQLQHQLA